MHLRLPGAVLVAVVTGCAGSKSSNDAAPAPRHDPDLITAEELATANTTTLYDAVRRLRPNWMMRNRTTTLLPQNQGQLIVYLDGSRYGGMESLRQLPPVSVAFLRYYSPGNAEARFGPGHLLGAIEVKTLPH